MSLSSKLFSGALAISAFAFAASAQDSAAKPSGEKDDRVMRGERHGRGDSFGRHGGRGGFGLRGIDLTDAQREQLRQIHEANKPSEAQMTEMRTLHEAKRNGTLTADQEARLKAIREEGRQKAESVRAQVMNLLTPEQKAQLEQRKQEMKQRRDQMREQRKQRDQNRPKDTTTTDTTKVT